MNLSPEHTWLIYYDDVNVKPEIFSGAGAEFAAKKRYEQAKHCWSCTLFTSYKYPYYATTLVPMASGYGIATGNCHTFTSTNPANTLFPCAKCAVDITCAWWLTQYGNICDACYNEEFVEKPGGC